MENEPAAVSGRSPLRDGSGDNQNSESNSNFGEATAAPSPSAPTASSTHQGTPDTQSQNSSSPSSEINHGLRHRAGTNNGPENPAPADPLEPQPGDTPQERRRRRLRRDREQLLSLINANPVACLCILVAASLVVIGVGYFFYELHLAYKYSSIIQKLHVSSLKEGYGSPSKFSSSQKAKPSPSSSLSPASPEVKKLPMLDEETEMYANQLQSVLSSLKRTLDRIDPTTNSTTLIAGLVELKPMGSKDETKKPSGPGFSTEIHSDDAKDNPALGTSPNEDLYTFLTKGRKNAKIPHQNVLHEEAQVQNEGERFPPGQAHQSFPDYLRELKTSLEAETKRTEDKMAAWIEKHRHEYANEDDWNEAVERKRAKEDDYARFLDAMFYVAEELEGDLSESGYGAVEKNNEDDSVTLGKLLEILAKGAKPSDDDDEEYSSDVSGDTDGLKKFDKTDKTEHKKKKKLDNDWAYDMWDDDEDDDWMNSEEDRAEPQFA